MLREFVGSALLRSDRGGVGPVDPLRLQVAAAQM